MSALRVYSASGCILCDEVADAGVLARRLGARIRAEPEILLDSEHFLLIRDILPLVPGHTLLVTREHVKCLALLSPALVTELVAFKREAAHLVSHAYGKPFYFEHGSMSDTPRSGACVNHAHLHVIPGEAPVADWIEEFGNPREVVDLHGALELCNHEGSDYLFYEDCAGRSCVVPALETRPPSQFIRRSLASHLGIENWNWKSVFLRGFPAILPQAPAPAL